MKEFKKNILLIVLTSVICSFIGGVSAYSILASNVSYTPRDKNWKVNNVHDAVDSLQSSIRLPAGTIISFASNKVPDGYLKCEGQEVSRSEFDDLFEVIGTTYGAGNGSTTFNLPDLRGEFLRGSGNNSHSNQGNGGIVGEHQDGTNHINFGTTYYDINWPGGNQVTGNGSNFDSSHTKVVGTYSGRGATDNSWQSNRFYTSRPTNTSVLYLIKY